MPGRDVAFFRSIDRCERRGEPPRAMTTPISDKNLLAQLAGLGAPGVGSRALDTLAATEPQHDPPPQEANAKLDSLTDRIRRLTEGTPSISSAGAATCGARQ